MWLGVTLDTIPEALLLGFMTAERTISYSLLVALFIANFPEAFSAASLLKPHMSVARIMLMWTALFVLTGLLAMVGCIIMGDDAHGESDFGFVRSISTSIMEGLAGGALMAMVATAMLPEAFHEAGQEAGLLFVLGFSVAVILSSTGARYGEPESLSLT